MPNMVVKQNNMLTDSGTSGKPTVAQNLVPVKPNSSSYSVSNPYSGGSSSGGGGGRGRSGGGGGSSSGGGAGVVPTGGGDTYWDASSVWTDYLNRMMAAADATYSANMEAISNAYNTNRNLLNSNLESTMGRLNDTNERSKKDIRMDADSSQRQAYINKMRQNKGLKQQMAALGMNGGASESTARSLSNNYSNARNQIDTQRNASLSDLLYLYNQNVASAQEEYNNRMAQLETQRMNAEIQARAARDAMMSGFSTDLSGLAVANGDYMNLLNQLVANQQAFSYNPSQAVNTPMLATAMQGGGLAGAGNDYSRYGAWLSQQAMRGADLRQSANYLLNQGVDRQTLNQFLAGYGVAV